MKSNKVKSFFRAFLVTLIIVFCTAIMVVGFAVCNKRNEKSLLGQTTPKNIVEFWD